MSKRRILLIQGHPDPAGGHLDHALSDCYAEAAQASGHAVERLTPATMDLPFLRNQAEFSAPTEIPAVRNAQAAIARAEHLVIIYPLWLGTMPAVLKNFFEQALRPGFALDGEKQARAAQLLRGRSARIIITMGMPALAYRWWYGAHSLKSLERNILRFCGIAPVRATLFGMAGQSGKADTRRRFGTVKALGQRGA